MKRTHAGLGVLLSLMLAGCNEQPSPSIPMAATSATTAAPVIPTSSPEHPQPLGIPYTVTDSGLAAEATVFAVDQNIAQDAEAPASGGHWAGADVQVCLKEAHGDFTVAWSDWAVSDSSNGQYQATTERMSEFPTPQFPFAPESLAVGECVRGWVMFAVAYGVDVTIVKYKPVARIPAFWSAQ